jgi:hypothetical protein
MPRNESPEIREIQIWERYEWDARRSMRRMDTNGFNVLWRMALDAAWSQREQMPRYLWPENWFEGEDRPPEIRQQILRFRTIHGGKMVRVATVLAWLGQCALWSRTAAAQQYRR